MISPALVGLVALRDRAVHHGDLAVAPQRQARRPVRARTGSGSSSTGASCSTRTSAATSSAACSTTSCSRSIVVPLQTACALGLALLLNRRLRGMSVFRTFFFMPVVFPMALVAVVWKLIYSRDDLGMLNAFVHAISFGRSSPTDWLGDPKTALLAIVIMSIWQGVGFQMVIILAGAAGDPAEPVRGRVDRQGQQVAAVPQRHDPAAAQHADLRRDGDDDLRASGSSTRSTS